MQHNSWCCKVPLIKWVRQHWLYTYMIQAVHSIESTFIKGYPCKTPGNACFISNALNIPEIKYHFLVHKRSYLLFVQILYDIETFFLHFKFRKEKYFCLWTLNEEKVIINQHFVTSEFGVVARAVYFINILFENVFHIPLVCTFIS